MQEDIDATYSKLNKCYSHIHQYIHTLHTHMYIHMQEGIDVNYGKLDSYEYSGLHYAAWKGKTEAVRLLIELGAKVCHIYTYTDIYICVCVCVCIYIYMHTCT